MCAELPRRVPAGGIGSLPAVLPAGAGAALGVHRTGEAAPSESMAQADTMFSLS